jgi:hypothetical protein
MIRQPELSGNYQQIYLVAKQEERGEKWQLNLTTKYFFHTPRVLKILRHGNEGFTYPLKEIVPLNFIALKNPSSSAGFELANLGSRGKYATTILSRATTLSYMTKLHGIGHCEQISF